MPRKKIVNYSIKQIAQHFGCDPRTIRRKLYPFKAFFPSQTRKVLYSQAEFDLILKILPKKYEQRTKDQSKGQSSILDTPKLSL